MSTDPAATVAPTEDTAGKITEAEIDRARAQVGIPQPAKLKMHDAAPSSAGISHFAFSYGDDNPLYRAPEYGKTTRWRSQIAPPSYLAITGVNEAAPFSPEQKKQFRQLFKGVGEYVSGFTYEWWRPVRPGDDIYYETTRAGVHVVENSKFAGGRSVHLTSRNFHVDGVGAPVGMSEVLVIAAERGASKKSGKHDDVKAWVYTDEDIAKIDAIYAAEETRGAAPRYWEDVEVGDLMQPLAKGPITVTDIIAEHMGRGMGHYDHGPLRYWWKQRQKMPGFYTKNRSGIPDVVQRLHWEQDWAEKVGLPLPYDYGDMRMNWMAHLVTQWMGDDAWLWRMFAQVRAFNFIGDFHVMEGKVAGKRIEDGRHVVDLEIKGTSQRGWVTCPGTATVILPTRATGVALLPRPPEEFVLRGAQMVAEGARLKRGGKARII
jgi:acyl dehydratase